MKYDSDDIQGHLKEGMTFLICPKCKKPLEYEDFSFDDVECYHEIICRYCSSHFEAIAKIIEFKDKEYEEKDKS